MRKNIYFPLMAVLLILAGCSSQKKMQADQPAWLQQKIKELKEQPVQNPPASVYQYTFQGETVFYIPAPCCDQFSTLYNFGGDIICRPDGGITGNGDGKCPQFFSQSSDKKLIWKDSRQTAAEQHRKLDPEQSVPVQQKPQQKDATE